MANADGGGAPAPHGFWQWLKSFVMRQLSGITIVGVLGLLTTLIIAYFQNLSAYQDKVTTLAKDDMTGATQVLAEASTALSSALSLQQRLVKDFYDALPNDANKDENAYPTKDARAVYKDYLDAYTSLHQNYNLLARKAEIYLDWPSNLDHDAAQNTTPTLDPINMSMLGEFDFDCEESMPEFSGAKSKVTFTDDLALDWNSAKHHVLAIQYCFDVTHQSLTAALQWASQSAIDPVQWANLANDDRKDLFNNKRAANQVLRLNAFISLAMSEIEQIRVKYRPNGYWCSVPLVPLVMSKKCTPVKVATESSAPAGVSTPARKNKTEPIS
jgi:hypothetical protein